MIITKETIRRAVRTFGQSAVGYVLANIALIDFSSGKDVARSALIGLAVSAFAAGLSAVMNLQKKKEA